MSKQKQAMNAALQKTAKVCVEVHEERLRQDILVVKGKLPWNCSNKVSDLRKLPVLIEEVGEVSKEVFELDSLPIDTDKLEEIKLRLRTELIQVAAVCVAWVEALTEDEKS